MAKKIRFTVPYNISKVILEDIEDFLITNNRLLNIIFDYYKDKRLELNKISSENGKSLQFNLWKKNEDIYYEKLKENNVSIEAEYFRSILYYYINQPKYLRERLLKDDIVKKIETSIQEEIKIKIFYNNEYRVVEPYFIIESGGESRNYLFCYCQKNKAFRNYRLQKINDVSIFYEKQEKKDSKYIKNIKKNFDPYLSYGKTVKVKLSEKGIDLLDINKIDKPKLISINKSIYTFECSEIKAKLYFSKFYENIEILEPTELRYWFIKKIKSNLKVYEKNKEEI